ncbi:flavin-dependent dehydrogenase [Haloferula luteola]|uniref:Flavin-dependent dehydrogenase n=1 Tax=Haloferula luteola TaxID=595692 RepID=A0A840VCU8_9BACT|nr:NAD(P)/FAD-dependent oxidoreductase [Haloferula luteola]MBB5353354.1 flavin-dependent dehydrogenase [Haloferula luteola]
MVSAADPLPATSAYDVVILGGAFSGSALGILLKRERPQTRILILEKSTEFDRKIGESTSEVAGCFLTRVLGLSNYLARDHFQKHGLRMWFTTPENSCPSHCSEIGPFSQARFPTYQLNRAKLDPHLLEEARRLGCDIVRPATVKSFDLQTPGPSTVTYKTNGETHSVTAAWVVDASGKAALIARQRGTLVPLPEHPVHSMWVRFQNVRDLDCHESHAGPLKTSIKPVVSRGSATNHLMGRGWWSWIIPLANGEFSAGVTWDERLCTPPSEGPVGQRVKQHLLTHPIGRLMFENAIPVENDARIYKHLPYRSTEVCGDGWIAIGDAAGFMDPLYSHGLDFCAHSISIAHRLIHDSLDGQCVQNRIASHYAQYQESYFRWFRALYLDKYQYLGDARLMRAAFLLDIATYFIGPVQLVYRDTDREFSKMPYNGPIGAVFAHFMALYNRRLELIARKRLAAGTYGKENLDHSYLIRTPFNAGLGALRHFFKGIWIWLSLEGETLFQRPIPAMQSPSPSEPATRRPETTKAMA